MEENTIYQKDNFIEFLYKNNTYKIPSDSFPLSNNDFIILNSTNTAKLNNKKIENIFNKTKYEVGRCYTNSEILYQNLIDSGISKHHLQYLVGWLFLGEGTPIHHAIILYKKKYYLDLSTTLSGKWKDRYQKSTKNVNTLEEFRRKYIEFIKEIEQEPHTVSGTYGKMAENMYFIGCNSSKTEGIEIYNKLIQKYPNHITRALTNEKGETKAQVLMNK